jgi:putative addiction module killer protein
VEASARTIRVYERADGDAPFGGWLAGLRDKRAVARIDARINRLKLGNFGDCRSVGEGVRELRIDHGPGYRVYFGTVDDQVVLLLCGGDKRTQSRDIERAKQYWQEVQNANQKLR